MIGRSTGNRLLRLMVAAIGLWAARPGPIWAEDGVVEINQASALASGGFPVVLGSTGSYKLTSNLDLRSIPDSAGKRAIEVAAPGVTIDLNGFSIIGPFPCVEGVPSTSAFSSGIEWVGGGHTTTIRNGIITGFGEYGLHLADLARVVEVHVSCTGSWGIRVGSLGRVERSSVERSTLGILAGNDSVLFDNEVRDCASVGILPLLNSLRGNVLDGNNGGNQNPQLGNAGSVFPLGVNRCGNVDCRCANEILDAGETCDDGNYIPGDGCSPTCQIE